jgi:hypothetical protein
MSAAAATLSRGRGVRRCSQSQGHGWRQTQRTVMSDHHQIHCCLRRIRNTDGDARSYVASRLMPTPRVAAGALGIECVNLRDRRSHGDRPGADLAGTRGRAVKWPVYIMRSPPLGERASCRSAPRIQRAGNVGRAAVRQRNSSLARPFAHCGGRVVWGRQRGLAKGRLAPDMCQVSSAAG